MIIKYKYSKYRLNWKDALYIKYLQYRSLGGRILRLIQRICKSILEQSIVFIGAIVFLAVATPIGYQMGIYKNWYDGIWDLRGFILSSIFILVFGNVINNEKTRHKILEDQLDLYDMITDESNQFMDELCRLVGIQSNYNAFFTYSHAKKLSLQIKNSKFESVVDNRQKLKCICNNYLAIIYEYNKILMSKHFIVEGRGYIGYLKSDFAKKIEDFLIEIDGADNDELDNITIRFVNEIVEHIYFNISRIRYPWRSHFARDENIRNLLKRGKCLTDIDQSGRWSEKI